MDSIRHQVGIQGTLEQVFKALATLEGLAGWWTSDTRGDGIEGRVIQFYFDEFKMEMKVLNSTPGENVTWQCISGDSQWIDTEISFTLRQDDSQVWVDFEHGKWASTTPLFCLCSTKWAVYLLSLKELIESGKGRPYPDDVPINHS